MLLRPGRPGPWADAVSGPGPLLGLPRPLATLGRTKPPSSLPLPHITVAGLIDSFYYLLQPRRPARQGPPERRGGVVRVVGGEGALASVLHFLVAASPAYRWTPHISFNLPASHSPPRGLLAALRRGCVRKFPPHHPPHNQQSQRSQRSKRSQRSQCGAPPSGLVRPRIGG